MMRSPERARGGRGGPADLADHEPHLIQRDLPHAVRVDRVQQSGGDPDERLGGALELVALHLLRGGAVGPRAPSLPPASRRFTLAEAADAMRFVEEGRPAGKIVVTV